MHSIAEPPAIHFCYRIAPIAGVAHDANGINTSAYTEMVFHPKDPKRIEKMSEALHEESVRELLARSLDIPVVYLQPISYEEFVDCTEEEGTHGA